MSDGRAWRTRTAPPTRSVKSGAFPEKSQECKIKSNESGQQTSFESPKCHQVVVCDKTCLELTFGLILYFERVGRVRGIELKDQRPL